MGDILNSKINVLDIFCGAGGMSRGFEEAGFNIKYAIDKDKGAIETFKNNHPNTEVLEMDVKDVKFNTFTDVDLIIGGFPCTPFSNANRKNIDNHPDKFLYKEYLRAIKEINPKVFIMENVNGVINEDIKGNSVLKNIISDTKKSGYNVNYWMINMAYWGLPQKRQRVIIIGSRIGEININNYDERNNLGLVTVRDAIEDLELIEPISSNVISYSVTPMTNYQKERRKNSKDLYNHISINHGIKFLEKIEYIKQGENWSSIPTKLISTNKSRQYNSYRRLEYNNQSITIVNVRKSCVLHPVKNRVLTAREAARLQGFDDNYIFFGEKDSVYQQIANAVPPLVAKSIAFDILKLMN